MKIVLVITGLGTGGAERLLTNLADCYVALGHEVFLVRCHGVAELCPQDARVTMISLEMRRNLLGVITALYQFRKLLLELRPDVVNSHLVHANIFCRVLRLFVPISILITSAHNTNEESQLRMLGYRLTDRLADISTNVSEEAVNAFEKKRALRPGRMLSILNGIDAQVFYHSFIDRLKLRNVMAVNNETTVFLAVGRLWEQKDYPNMLRSLLQLRTLGFAPELWIVGEGPQRNELETLAAALGLQNQVKFLGLRNDIIALMSACDVYLMSSAWEGLPMVILEAMACECPVVATDCGGVLEALGSTKFLAPPGDPAALAQILATVLALAPAELKQLGQDNRQRVIEHFSLDSTAKNYLSLYQNVPQA